MTKSISKSPEISLVLNNIRSAYNVGSIFRTADGAGINKIYLCGYTPVPASEGNPSASSGFATKVAKTALGVEKIVPWEQHKQTWRLLKKLKKDGFNIIALERFDRLIASKLGVQNIFKFKPKFPMAILAGHERQGLSKKILEYVDKIIEIPMHGKKESLNVSVAVGIVVYFLKK